MSNYLFTLTITPVQSFIRQARKTKDLFVGSEILSSLMKKALEEIDEKEIIFPQNREFVSNKFVAKLENKDPKEVGEKLENSINKDFINLIFKNTNKCDSAFYDFFKVYWVAVKLSDDYKKSYKQLEQNLGAIKNLRDFKQNTQPEGKAKCVLCGERNQEEENNGDKLCLICYTKRVCTKDNKSSFPSTEDISNEKRYYALIQIDIDDMGKKLSSLEMDKQQELSGKLGEFTQKTKDIISKKYTIYAGGDDFLGFIELEKLFDIMHKIKQNFSIPNMTFSTSIVIAHDKAPLHKVLDFSRELLAETKNHFDDKNGVGIVVMSNSAINAKTICKYKDFCLLEEMRSEKIGMSLHYKLHTIFSYLDSMSYDDFLTQKQMIKVEIKRLLKREEGSFDEKLYSRLIAFLDKQKIELSTNNYKIDFDNFIGYLKTLEQLRKVL
jgi:CRISPR-associated protein Cmr2